MTSWNPRVHACNKEQPLCQKGRKGKAVKCPEVTSGAGPAYGPCNGLCYETAAPPVSVAFHTYGHMESSALHSVVQMAMVQALLG